MTVRLHRAVSFIPGLFSRTGHGRQSLLIAATAVVAIVVLAEAVLLIVPTVRGFRVHDRARPDLESYAEEVIGRCGQEPYPPGCYDREIPKFMDVLTLEEAFTVTKIVQQRDPNYWYCHVLGHNLSARETAKDPSAWKDVINRCPSGMCSNGCLHGAFQERFRAEALPPDEADALIPELAGACERRPGLNLAGLEQASCYHALGHLVMYITSADLRKSNELCRRIAVKPDGRNFLQTCYEGNFMQIFQPLEPEDFALVEGRAPTKDGLSAFCAAFPGEPGQACWREGWPLFREELATPAGLTSFCAHPLDEGQQRKCYNAMVYVLTAQFNFDGERIKNLCSGLEPEWKAQCFANAASRMVETDAQLISPAVAMCHAAAGLGIGDRCYQELAFYSTFAFHPGSTHALQLCGALPEPWHSTCLGDN